MAEQPQSSVTELVSSAITDAQALVKDQIELTKAELQTSAKQAAATSGMFLGAAVLAFLAFTFLLVAAAYGLVALGLSEWAGFLIVALLLIAVAATLGLLGRKRAKQITGPERSIAALNETSAALQAVKP